MVVDERSRRLHEHLHQILGPEDATTLIEQFSPVPWSELATKADVHSLRTDVDALRSDLDGLRTEFHAERVATREQFHQVHTEMQVLRVTINTGFQAQDHKMGAMLFEQRSAILEQMTAQTRTMIVALITVVIALASVFVATAR